MLQRAINGQHSLLFRHRSRSTVAATSLSHCLLISSFGPSRPLSPLLVPSCSEVRGEERLHHHRLVIGESCRCHPFALDVLRGTMASIRSTQSK